MATEINKEALEKLMKEKATQQFKSNESPKLSEAELEKVAGGFTETDAHMGAWGSWVQCANCGASQMGDFDITYNDMYSLTRYRCRRCGYEFIVYGNSSVYNTGYVVPYNDFTVYAGNNGWVLDDGFWY